MEKGRGFGVGRVLVGGRKSGFRYHFPFLSLRLFILIFFFLHSHPTGTEVPVLYAHLRDGLGGYTSLGSLRLQKASGPIRGA